MKWFRWYHGSINDPKFRVIAKRADCTLERVIFVWAAILESASQNDERGQFGIEVDELSIMLDCDEEDIEKILLVMSEKGIITENNVVAWERRQYEGDNSTQRVKRYRERQKANKNNGETQCNGNETLQKRDETERNAPEQIQSRTDTEKRDTRKRVTNPKDLKSSDFEAPPGISVERELEKFVNWSQANAIRHKDATAAFRNWLIKAGEFKHGDDPPPKPKKKLSAAAEREVDRLRTEAGNAMRRGDFETYKEHHAKANAIEAAA